MSAVKKDGLSRSAIKTPKSVRQPGQGAQLRVPGTRLGSEWVFDLKKSTLDHAHRARQKGYPLIQTKTYCGAKLRDVARKRPRVGGEVDRLNPIGRVSRIRLLSQRKKLLPSASEEKKKRKRGGGTVRYE